MECRGSLVLSHFIMPGLEPNEVRRGQLLALLTVVSLQLVLQLVVMLGGILDFLSSDKINVKFQSVVLGCEALFGNVASAFRIAPDGENPRANGSSIF